jgi:hypothetical protein
MPRVPVNQPEKAPRATKKHTIEVEDANGGKARRLLPINDKQLLKLRQWEIDYRFVKEVEYLERDGRVSARPDLELAVGLETGGVANIRNGMRGVSCMNVVLLFELYRGDKDYILLGAPRNTDLYKPFIPGVGRLNIHEAYYHRYPTAARWKVGPRPEFKVEHPTLKNYSPYYPQDPDNEGWTAPLRKSIKSLSDDE